VPDNTARSILGQLVMCPALISASDELCADLFGGRDKLIFQAIDKLWNESQPEMIPLPLLTDRLGDKVSPAYVSSLLDGISSVQPDGFVSLVKELSRRKVAKAIVKLVSDGGEEIVKTGDIDLSTLKPLVDKYAEVSAGDKERVMSANIREWAMVTAGEFSLPMAYKELGARTTQEQGLVRVVLHKLVKDGELIPVGRGYGHYRKVEKELEQVDLLGTVPTPVDLYLPLGLHNLVNIYPRSIILIAGASNKGKSTLAYDFIKGNMDRHECHLFFSEGGTESLRDRLDKHTDKMIGEWRFRAYPRTKNFEDVMFPDDLNVIDYLLVGDEFWKVGTMLDDIYRKLGKGIAYVNIQKNTLSEFGRGGEFSLERPQLYVTLSPDPNIENHPDNVQPCIAKIIKSKSWKKKWNPDGRQMPFQIEDGWKITHWSNWEFPPKKEKKSTEFHPRRSY
jgi:hypothetical protein